MESIIEVFHIDIKALLAQIINFAIVFFVLYRYAIKPLMKLMTERTETIEKGLADAKSSAAALERAEVEYNNMLTKARQERQEIMEAAKRDAEQKGNDMINQAKDEVNKIVTTAKNQLQQEKLKIIEDARSEVIDLVTKGVAKVLDKGVTHDLDKKYIESVIKE